jgi:hypothetical protein
LVVHRFVASIGLERYAHEIHSLPTRPVFSRYHLFDRIGIRRFWKVRGVWPATEPIEPDDPIFAGNSDDIETREELEDAIVVEYPGHTLASRSPPERAPSNTIIATNLDLNWISLNSTTKNRIDNYYTYQIIQ